MTLFHRALHLRTFALLAVAAAIPNLARAAAPCTSVPDCTVWLPLAGGPARTLVYRSGPLNTPNPAITRALIIIHGASRDADNYFRSALASLSSPEPLIITFLSFPALLPLAAVEEGIVPGGGAALLRAGKVLAGLKLGGDEQIGVDIIRRACEEPVRQIVNNAGIEGAIVLGKIRENDDYNFGYNAQTEVYEDLVAASGMDPAKVTRSALQNAASIAGLMLTTEAMVCEIPEKKSAPAGGRHGPEGMDY